MDYLLCPTKKTILISSRITTLDVLTLILFEGGFFRVSTVDLVITFGTYH